MIRYWFLLLMLLAVAVGCASTPDGDGAAEESAVEPVSDDSALDTKPAKVVPERAPVSPEDRERMLTSEEINYLAARATAVLGARQHVNRSTRQHSDSGC